MKIRISEKVSHPLVTGCPPAWASGWGQDLHGIWLAFSYQDVEQRMRWIPPGQFMMGSPEGEAGRFSDEKQHPVTLTRGFWLFDNPVIQALWKAVMGENPSRFQSDDRPVEQVSWETCREFMEKLNREMPGLELTFPSEAQWEYACRAGTTAATYIGDLEIVGHNNAPLLDEIAWYGGNSGVDFELDNGEDSSSWLEKQYDHQRAGTHPIGLKRPNPWGLYDMLGNVWEWCADWWQDDLDRDAVVDPTGPEKGDHRVYRGGGWGLSARYVRAASRFRVAPGIRLLNLGFRCARV
ncbi:MAG: formylglycine-generating enzyme family protein, partial [Calditrichaeota bacterium]|nr:formylglycine-generating enzyme family protein [Calditrichota bacterium]